MIVFTGTGTGIGKTFLAVATVHALARSGARVVGYKPVESGVVRIEDSDGYLLELASTFHVKPSLPVVRLAPAVSAHVAARQAGVQIDLEVLAAAVGRARGSEADAVVMELPGGLFSPMTDSALAVDFVDRLRPDALVLVAPDRLGVLHEVLATTEAARGRGVVVTHVLLSPTRTPDGSTGENASELRRLISAPVIDAAAFGDIAPPSATELARSLHVGLPHTQP